jgi:hypothetical protein
MDIERIIEWYDFISPVNNGIYRTLKNGSSYPGKHNYPTERTSPACKPLEPKSQVSTKMSLLYLDDDYLERNDRIFDK